MKRLIVLLALVVATAHGSVSEDSGLTVVVPTYNERENIVPLLSRLASVAEKLQGLEVIFVDDMSADGTGDAVKRYSRQQMDDGATLSIVLYERDAAEGTGLSSAVVKGFSLAKRNVICAMDADLSHPPETLPEMERQIRSLGNDFAIGSRYMDGGGVEGGWPLKRRIISFVASMLARPLVTTSDPMSGFFCTRKAIFGRAKRQRLNAIGFKIGLEMLVKSRAERVADVPILFRDRVAGASKLKMSTQINYVWQLLQLYMFACWWCVVLMTVGGCLFTSGIFYLGWRWRGQRNFRKLPIIPLWGKEHIV